MSGKAQYLEMDFPMPNELIKWCDRVCCRWGQKKPPYDTEGNIRGATAPLWMNPSKTFYKVFFALCLVCSLLFIGSFIAIQYYDNNKNSSTTNSTATAEEIANNNTCVEKSHQYLKSWFIIIGSAILLINAMFCVFLICVDYASDQQWSRYLVYHTVCWAGLVGFLIGDFLTTVENLNYYNNDTDQIFNKTGTNVCNQLFQLNLWSNLVVAIIISILAVLLIIKIILIAHSFFFVKYVPHSAICTDDDIIVLA